MTKEKKRLIFRISACVLTLLVFFSSVTYAWFSRQHNIARMQEVVPPNAIFLSAAHRKAEINFQIGEVNTSADATHRDYVFSVSGTGVPYYLLELAHTTNNPFTYTIYPAKFSATKPKSGTDGVDYVSFTAPSENTTGAPATVPNDVTVGTTYYYTINGEAISGTYLNAIGGSSPLIAQSSGTQHNATYNTGDNPDLVQKNAEPLYWKSTVLSGSSDAFCHNYIIRVDWDGATLDKKTKETDIIYLYASTTSAP